MRFECSDCNTGTRPTHSGIGQPKTAFEGNKDDTLTMLYSRTDIRAWLKENKSKASTSRDDAHI